MSKRVGKINGSKSPWKHAVKTARRVDAEARQAVYDAKSFEEKVRFCGRKELAKLAKKQETK